MLRFERELIVDFGVVAFDVCLFGLLIDHKQHQEPRAKYHRCEDTRRREAA